MHQFLKLGATPVTTPQDIIDALHLTRVTNDLMHMSSGTGTSEEILILEILTEPRDHDTIIRALPFSREETLTLLMRMELNGRIKEQNGMFYKIN